MDDASLTSFGTSHSLSQDFFSTIHVSHTASAEDVLRAQSPGQDAPIVAIMPARSASLNDTELSLVVDEHTSLAANQKEASVNDVPSSLDGMLLADDTVPTWTELKTKAGKERKRLPLACIACRRKKIKCSGEKPACKHCTKARLPCVYKVTTKKAAPRTDYMAMLDKRLKRMEDRVIRSIPTGSEEERNTIRSSVKPPALCEVSPSNMKAQSSRKRSADRAFTPATDSINTKGHVLRPTSNTEGAVAREAENRLLLEGAEELPPQHIQEHLTQVFFDNVYGQSYLLLHKSSFMRKLKARTVPPVLMLAVCALSARFSNHPQLSTEPAFLRGAEWADAARQIAERRHFEPNVTIVTVMIILGLHYFGTCEGGLSWSFGGMAMRMAYALQLHKELDLDPLGHDEISRVKAPDVAEPKVPAMSFTDREIQRRLMWSCVFMDAFNSSGTERPAMISEEYMQIQLPVKESNFQMEISGLTEHLCGKIVSSRGLLQDQESLAQARSNMGVAAYLVRAIVLWKNTIRYLNLGGREKDPHPIWESASHFAALVRQVKDLRTSLPDSLKYTRENLEAYKTEKLANQFLFMHIVLAQCSLFLHRFAIPVAPNTPRAYPAGTPKEFLAAAATTVVDAATSISRIIAQSIENRVSAPFASYAVYSSSTVHIWGIFSKNSMLEQTSRELLRENFKYLNHMKRYWGMVHYMVENIRETFARFSNAAKIATQKPSELKLSGESTASQMQTAPSSPAGSTASSAPVGHATSAIRKSDNSSKMLQYNDWLDRYPRGVDQAEWQKTSPKRTRYETDKEAVLSQPSELQSVEEFFATLTPPSKAVQTEGSVKGRGLARKRAKANIDRQKDVQAQSDVPQQAETQLVPQQNLQHPSATSNLPRRDSDVLMSGIPSHMRRLNYGEPQPGSTPSSTLSPGSNASLLPTAHMMNINNLPLDDSHFVSQHYHTNGISAANHGVGINSNFQYQHVSALPQVDRQMVFSGYAGLDPSSTNMTHALNDSMGLDFWTDPWNGLPTNGNDATITHTVQDISPMQMSDFSMINQNNSSNLYASATPSAWMMPFNIDPPEMDGRNTSNTNITNVAMGGAAEFTTYDDMVDMNAFDFGTAAMLTENVQRRMDPG